jgi:hypothetical protein
MSGSGDGGNAASGAQKDARAVTNQLLALADRCEKASGPDRDLDAAIMGLFTNSVESDDGEWWYGPHDEMPGKVPAFTASLDAALSLVPEGWVTADANNLNISSNLGGWAWCLDNGADCGHPRFRDAVAKAKTPPLALCAAALRARATEEAP